MNDTVSNTSVAGEQSSLARGAIGGAAAALGGAILWAVITVATEFQIGWMAVGVGFLVGFAVRAMGKGSSAVFGVAGAVLALLGCLGGNYLSVVGFIAKAESVGYFQALGAIPLSQIPTLMAETFSAMDLLFYGIAIYEGFKLSMTAPAVTEAPAATT
jgi:hypothetical protein